MDDRSRELDIAHAFVTLADSLRQDYDIVDTFDLLVAASISLSQAVEAGVVLADAAGDLHVIASSSERTTDVEEAQLGTSAGPCFDSFHSGRHVEVIDLKESESKWPVFTEIAVSRAFRSSYAIPLTIRDMTIGSLNLFFDRPGPMNTADAALTVALAQVATIGVVQSRTIDHHEDLSERLRGALESRVVIEQAKGVLAQRHDVKIDEAFRLLRTYARSQQTRLHDTAQQVVAGEIRI